MGRVEFHTCILRIGQKDGMPTATVLASPSNLPAVSVSDFKMSGQTVTLAFRGGESIFVGGGTFTGTISDAKVVRGAITGDNRVFRAQLARTTESTLKVNLRLADYPEPLLAAWGLNLREMNVRSRAANEKDADRKKSLRSELEAVEKERDEKDANLLRETVEKYADGPFALDAAVLLLKSATHLKVPPEEAKRLIAMVQKSATTYGQGYVVEVTLDVADALAVQEGFAGTAVGLLRPIVEVLPVDASAAHQARILTTYKLALEGGGKADEARAVGERLAKLETKLDEEYLATVPPFKPASYAGRKDKTATRVAVVELFTGAECKPCIAADVAFDALGKAYKPTDLVLLQYHLHIPGPDPMTNSATEARANYYGIRGTPSVFLNGKSRVSGGGAMDAAEARYRRYVEAVDPVLEEQSPLKLTGDVKRSGDNLSVRVEANGLDREEELRLRLFVVEESVRYVGGNRLRFHHQIVRAMPGGPEGVAFKGPSFKHAATVGVAAIRTDLTKYLDEYAAMVQPFRSRLRPLDLKELKVVALVQDDKTKDVLQAVQFNIEGR
jgi:hypothetical protein